MAKIVVHEKALAHLSRGLYRSPASALRELVSNAWDANAETVEINTNYPLFLRLGVTDNGDGFSRESFEHLMSGNIGNSEKRPTHIELKYGRPLIGRLGIGMLGIAQICGSFTITSKMTDASGFRAHIRLFNFLKEEIDRDSPQVVEKLGGDVREVLVGEYDFDDAFDLREAPRGTSIVTEDMHPSFVQAFQQSVGTEDFRKPPLLWKTAIENVVSKYRSLQELGDYWRLLWELSAACPIPYISPDALPNHLVRDEQRRLQSYKFKVTVDNIELRKPVFLHNNPGGYTTKKIAEQQFRIYARDLRFHGYIAVQEGTQLRPDELRGIMIRINNVAIGYYDQTFLDYRSNEGPRSRWVTSEIYVDDGLEDALNIDRDSFNRFHPQFKALQKYIHDLLQKSIFPEVYKKIEQRSRKKRAQVRAKRASHVRQALESLPDINVRVEKAFGKTDAPKVVRRGKGVIVTLADDSQIATRKSHQQLAAAILAIFEVANSHADAEERRTVFGQLLLELLSKW
jgi:hypothetical protein